MLAGTSMTSIDKLQRVENLSLSILKGLITSNGTRNKIIQNHDLQPNSVLTSSSKEDLYNFPAELGRFRDRF
jgi:hypothetical protein